MQGLKSLVYGCMADERGLEEDTPHTHIYIACSSPVRFSTLQKLFDGVAHLEAARGTSQQNRSYAAKEGKWQDRDKSETKIEGSFEEWGEIPEETTVTCIEGAIITMPKPKPVTAWSRELLMEARPSKSICIKKDPPCLPESFVPAGLTKDIADQITINCKTKCCSCKMEGGWL